MLERYVECKQGSAYIPLQAASHIPTLPSLTPTSTLMGLNRIPGGILIRGRLLRLKASRHIPSFIRGQQRGAGVSERWHGSVSAAFTATKHLQAGLRRYNVDQAAVVKGDYMVFQRFVKARQNKCLTVSIFRS